MQNTIEGSVSSAAEMNEKKEGASPLEQMEAMSPLALREKIRTQLTPERQARFKDNDYDLIIGLARRFLRNEFPETLEGALDLGIECREEALDLLGKELPGAFTKDKEGTVLATGTNAAQSAANAAETRADMKGE